MWRKVPSLTLKIKWMEMPGKLVAYTDSDWAGDAETRQSTSSGCVLWGTASLKHWSRQQKVIAKCSAEAALYAATAAISELKGLASMLADLCVAVTLEVAMDAKATMGILQRVGLGKLKHMSVHHLWAQAEVRAGNVTLRKVHTSENLADVGTKALPSEIVGKLAQGMGFH